MPRPDTETVVELALEMLRAGNAKDRPLRIADLGTGTGAILLALLSELPDATGIGTDVSAEALRTAQANAARLGFSDRAAFVRCDYASALSGPFDLIVSKPALYSLRRYRRPCARGPRPRSAAGRSMAAPTAVTPTAS